MGKNSDHTIDVATRPPRQNDRTRRTPLEPRAAAAYWGLVRQKMRQHTTPSLRNFAESVATAARATEQKRTREEVALQIVHRELRELRRLRRTAPTPDE